MRNVWMLALCGCWLAATTAVALAEDRNKAKDEANQQITDEQFVRKASQGGLAEVNHGMLAATKAVNPAVKAFAQRMVADHGKANQELIALANQRQFNVAKDMGEKHTAMHEKLSRMSGEEFDRHYMRHMVEGHRKAIALFKAEAEQGKDKDLKAFADRTLPTLQEHLKMAEQIEGRLKGNAAEKTRTSDK